jgi:4-amino-4-deoxy-L-arabinose transferase-like glycosyltransferase
MTTAKLRIPSFGNRWSTAGRNSSTARTDAPAPHRRRPDLRARIHLLGIVVGALVLRAYWAVHHGAVLEGNGCEYARIAENLAKHSAYVGLFEGPELMFPPFYPVLLALGSFVVGSVDHAARIIPVVTGVVLVVAAFGLGRVLYGPRVGLTFAALTAFHPLLIDLSSTAYSEGVYLPLMLGGLYWGLCGLKSGQRRPIVLCGMAFGLAALTRPEAFFYPLALLGGSLLSDTGGPSPGRRIVRRALWLMTPMVIVVAPYAVYVSVHTGSLKFEGKGLMDYTIGTRINAGMNPVEAAFGIGPDLSEQGPQLSPNHYAATPHPKPSMRAVSHYWLTSARRNWPALRQALSAPAFGSFLAIGLVAVGLVGRPWSRWRATGESVLLQVAGGHLLLLLGLHFVLPRYMFPLLLISMLWVAKGIDEVAWWSLGTTRRALSGHRWPELRLANGARGALIIGILLLALWGVHGVPLQDQGPEDRLLRDVGTWLDDYHAGPKRIMTIHPEVAYYSGGTWLPLPYAEASLSLRYIRRKHPDFIVLTGMGRAAPYLSQWLEHGIPANAARPIYRAGPASPAAVAIYEWRAQPPGLPEN